MSGLRQRLFLHVNLSRGGFVYGYEILDTDGRAVGTMSKRREKSDAKISILYRLDEQEFSTAEELATAYQKKLESERRDQEWEAAAP